MITLTKSDEKHKIVLDKSSSDIIVVTAQWTDNGDNRSDNDDLDLRAGLLLPDGKMQMIHCDDKGKLNEKPYIEHMGDVKGASKDAFGEEVMKVNPKIAQYYGGPVAIVLSVYSAIGNGAVSVASLKPRMKIQYKDQIIECFYDFSVKKDEKPKGFFKKIFSAIAGESSVYTYVIGLVKIINDEVEISPSGVTSTPHSESTPKLQWESGNNLKLTMTGPPLFKDSI